MSEMVYKLVRRYLIAHDRRESAQPGGEQYESADAEMGRLLSAAVKYGIADEVDYQIAAAFGAEEAGAMVEAGGR